mgnify:CR=1
MSDEIRRIHTWKATGAATHTLVWGMRGAQSRASELTDQIKWVGDCARKSCSQTCGRSDVVGLPPGPARHFATRTLTAEVE